MRKFYRYVLVIFTLVCYLSVFIPPNILWLSGFLSLLIPVLIIFHFIFLILVRKKVNTNFLIHLIAFLVAIPFLKMTFQWSNWGDEQADSFEVLSYNARVFNNYAHLNDDYVSSKEMIKWAVGYPAAIKCFQEYYNKDNSEVFNVSQQLVQSGLKHFYFKKRFVDKSNGQFGQAVFSKYPIVGSGEITGENGEFMNAIYADILIKKDTIRVYCIHLESMAINEEDIVDTDRLKNSYIDTGYRLKNGFISRSRQINHLIKSIDTSPHPVIINGDFNEIPYSYSYNVVRRRLKNAFESKGKGFGFTYNGKLFFLRIDQQFYSESLDLLRFSTHRDADESDHFPVSGIYSVK